MRLLLALILIAHCLIAPGQEKSRIVFFRMDADIGAKSKSFWEGRLYTDELLFNDSVITGMRSASVFIFDSKNVSGTWFLAPHVSTDEHANRIRINAVAGSITFVKIKLSASTPITSYSEVISLDEFQKCYDAAKWLRRSLKNEGFTSVKELTQGFIISKKDSVQPLVKILDYHPIKRKLNDTAWIDKNNSAIGRDSAHYYSIVKEEKPGYFVVNDYFVKDNKLKTTGHYSNLDSQTRSGTFLNYSQDGILMSKENYDNGIAAGLWENFYDTLNGPVWYTSIYKNGALDGMLNSYYLNGKLKRTELHRQIVDTVFGTGRQRHTIRHINKRDSIIEGHRYNESGNEIEFTKFNVLPEAEYDYNEFLGIHIRYPENARKKGIEGRVVVRFTVEKDGTISDVMPYRRIDKELTDEALRVVALFPPWKPGLQDDKPARVIFTLPIMFKLH